MGGLAVDDTWGWNRYTNCYCWYTYYDVSGDGDNSVDQCLLDNRDDVLITPDQVPMDKMRFELMNNPAQQIVRQLLVAEAKILLGNIRGTYSGVVKIPLAEMQMDYNMFIEQGKAEREEALTTLKERLDRMLPWNLMKNQADMTDSLLKMLQSKPFREPIMVR